VNLERDMADFATLARAENARRAGAGVAELSTKATFADDDVFDYVISCDPTDKRSRLREAVRGIVSAGKTSGISIVHPEQMKENGETGDAWKIRWESQFAGHVRKCRKGVIVLMDKDYMKDHKDPRGARRREWNTAAAKGPKARVVVLLVDPDTLPQVGFVDLDGRQEEIKPDTEWSFPAFKPMLAGKDILATVMVGPSSTQKEADRTAARMAGAGTPLPGRAMVGAEGASRYGRGVDHNFNTGENIVLGEDKAKYAKSLVGADTVHVLDATGPRDYTKENVMTWAEERVYLVDPDAKDPKSKEMRKIQQVFMVWLAENNATGNKLFRLAQKLKEDGPDPDRVRMSAFQTAFPNNFSEYVGIPADGCAIWERERARIAKALILLPPMQKQKDFEAAEAVHDYKGHEIFSSGPTSKVWSDTSQAGFKGASTRRAGVLEGTVEGGHAGYEAEATARKTGFDAKMTQVMETRLEPTKEAMGVKTHRSTYKKLVAAGAKIRAGKGGSQGELPAGWKAVYDEDGDMYYVSFTDAVATYDDPRLTSSTSASKYLGTVHGFGGGASAKLEDQWTITALDSKRYTKMDKKKQDNKDKALHAAFGEEACTKKWNRYVDMLPNPSTVVKIPQVGDDKLSTYVNANYMRGPDNKPGTFIACMAPLKKSQIHFWRMVVEHGIKTILMVTGLKEKGVSKCPEYFPQKIGEEITHEGEKTIATIKCTAQQSYGSYINSKFDVTTKAGLGGEKKATVSHWWYTAWPDHGVPSLADGSFDVDGLLTMLEDINKNGDGIKTTQPQLVHCSAGVGRTGVVITLQNAMGHLQKSNKVNLLDLVEQLRNDRCLQVQQEIQYRFLHAAVVRYAEKMGREIVIEQIKSVKPKKGGAAATSTTMTDDVERAKQTRYKEKRGSVRRAVDVEVDIAKMEEPEDETFGFPDGGGGDEEILSNPKP